MNEDIKYLTDLGNGYHKHDQLTTEEITTLAQIARDGMGTIEGDTFPICVTARQLALLFVGGFGGSDDDGYDVNPDGTPLPY